MNDELCANEIFAPEEAEPCADREAEGELADESSEAIGEIKPNAPEEEKNISENENKKENEKEPDQDEKSSLLCRIAELECELAARDRNSAQKKELRELFPDADPDDLPDSVAEQYEKGVPLAAAYALYKHVQSIERRRAEEQSRKNAKLIPGELEGNTQNGYFTAEEVRAMSHGQVRMHFQSILDSMRHW